MARLSVAVLLIFSALQVATTATVTTEGNLTTTRAIITWACKQAKPGIEECADKYNCKTFDDCVFQLDGVHHATFEQCKQFNNVVDCSYEVVINNCSEENDVCESHPRATSTSSSATASNSSRANPQGLRNKSAKTSKPSPTKKHHSTEKSKSHTTLFIILAVIIAFFALLCISACCSCCRSGNSKPDALAGKGGLTSNGQLPRSKMTISSFGSGKVPSSKVSCKTTKKTLPGSKAANPSDAKTQLPHSKLAFKAQQSDYKLASSSTSVFKTPKACSLSIIKSGVQTQPVGLKKSNTGGSKIQQHEPKSAISGTSQLPRSIRTSLSEAGK